jgi:hypothetical protein
MKRFPRVLLIVVALVAGLMFGVAAPGDARTGHSSKMRLVEGHLKAHIIKDHAAECLPHDRRCKWDGDVRIFNLRPRGTGRVHVCVGIDVFTYAHDNLTSETSLSGQATAWVRPGHPKVKEFHMSYRQSHPAGMDVEVTSVHKYGNPC